MRALAILALVLSGCIHYVDSECKECRVLNARLKEGEHRTLPRLSPSTKTLFVLVPGALGYSWEWNPAIRALEAARKDGIEFVVFWWEPWGTLGAAQRELEHWVNDLLGANDVTRLERVEIVAHSMAGMIAARAAPRLIVPPHVRMRISTIGTAFAGMIGPEFGYPDSNGSFAVFSSFAAWLKYPAVPDDIELVEYRTTWPEDPVMEPRFGHDPAPLDIGPRPRLRVQLPHMNHNACVGLVVERILREDRQRSVEPGW